jgi:hypothetical protein
VQFKHYLLWHVIIHLIHISQIRMMDYIMMEYVEII